MTLSRKTLNEPHRSLLIPVRAKKMPAQNEKGNLKKKEQDCKRSWNLSDNPNTH
jgi:hypothetical protein